jgi:TRAP-type C4-dicarboxylate transport system substrate-binding protein
MGTFRYTRRSFLKTSAAIGASAALPAAHAQGTKTLKFGHMLPTDQVHHKAIALFAEELSKLSKNTIKSWAAFRRCCSRCRRARCR